MKLFKEPFSRIKSGKKVIEVRLFDEKRSKIKINDEIVFSLADDMKEQIKANVVGIVRFNTFKELYSAFHFNMFGHPEGTNLENQLKDIRQIYSEEEERKYGAVAILIKPIE